MIQKRKSREQGKLKKTNRTLNINISNRRVEKTQGYLLESKTKDTRDGNGQYQKITLTEQLSKFHIQLTVVPGKKKKAEKIGKTLTKKKIQKISQNKRVCMTKRCYSIH